MAFETVVPQRSAMRQAPTATSDGATGTKSKGVVKMGTAMTSPAPMPASATALSAHIARGDSEGPSGRTTGVAAAQLEAIESKVAEMAVTQARALDAAALAAFERAGLGTNTANLPRVSPTVIAVNEMKQFAAELQANVLRLYSSNEKHATALAVRKQTVDRLKAENQQLLTTVAELKSQLRRSAEARAAAEATTAVVVTQAAEGLIQSPLSPGSPPRHRAVVPTPAAGGGSSGVAQILGSALVNQMADVRDLKAEVERLEREKATLAAERDEWQRVANDRSQDLAVARDTIAMLKAANAPGRMTASSDMSKGITREANALFASHSPPNRYAAAWTDDSSPHADAGGDFHRHGERNGVTSSTGRNAATAHPALIGLSARSPSASLVEAAGVAAAAAVRPAQRNNDTAADVSRASSTYGEHYGDRHAHTASVAMPTVTHAHSALMKELRLLTGLMATRGGDDSQRPQY